MLVEDSRTFTAAVKTGLETLLGVSVEHCSSLAGLKALAETDPARFCLAVIDLNLPDAPNCQALDYVIAKDIPAIVFTGAFNDRTRLEVLSRDVLAYVPKHRPNAIDALIACVDQILDNAATRIMLVESDPALRIMISALLSRHQFAVSAVATADEALALLDCSGDIDVAVVNAGMDMSGFDLLRDIRMRHGAEKVRVIGMSETTDRMTGADFLVAGGDEFIHLPFLKEEFITRVTHVALIQRRIHALHRIAALDYLTDIFNRRHFFETGPRMVEQSMRRNAQSCIAIFDIDHFKRLNDTYGHEVGDLVLKAVAKRMKALVGDDHLLARLGGEEFGVLFNGLDIQEGFDFCERLRVDMANAKVIADDEELSITISIGLAVVSGDEAFDNYLNAADQFLYMAKHAGRNRTFSEISMLQSIAS
ncbi:GGDEF domain-containing response regulator [Pararhizobium sp.]|uniref:GGDEF domain-containing response regulator n=1 Tax=Pararhizobium sp. TaxID=1977563 RepID=UPI00271A7EE3|nr:diguanylate cyclase [Pararhizobium sp.]MDO9418736.1 diguanylate cyclase [Pararhizobium sp.]